MPVVGAKLGTSDSTVGGTLDGYTADSWHGPSASGPVRHITLVDPDGISQPAQCASGS